MGTNDSVNIARAVSEADRTAAYNLRYIVFGVDEGDHRYSDHERKIWVDADDDEKSHLWLARSGRRAVGTARARRFCEDMIARDCYHLDRLAKQLDTTREVLAERAMRIDRVVVAKEFRRTGLAGRMVAAIEQASVADGVDVLLAAIEPMNAGSQQAAGKYGWEPYRELATYGGFTAQTYLKRLTS